ncbi:adenine-specific methyltransferase EcoRI family protein [Allisonella histaminiformans]|uniref:adenine-specific methyltransferase EcoRI family protein n=1 Tax=Allisonella histaminiformans TaxID=209880 RepID=UPI002941DA36|nr:adenine-specific methyltransferase EcoRI family protein [Allisonella histaminiformans]
MSENASLAHAKKAKNDEFYTQYNVIEAEMNAYVEYNPDVFRGKTILLPCDDPEWSNFTKYFAANFSRFGLKKLISTSYALGVRNREVSLFEEESSIYNADLHKTHGKLFTLTTPPNFHGRVDIDNLQLTQYLEGDGDFRSEEVTKLRNEADIIITNPPFSLFREFLAWIMEADKKFIILGNVNAITYKEVFPLLKDNKLWLGYSIHSGDRKFNVPDDYPLEAANCGIDSDGKKFIRVKGVRWFTNIDHGKRHEWLKLDTMAHNLKFNKKLRKKLEKNFGTIAYPNYDNYDAIEVPFTECIPSDYDGVMGVPITFMDKYNPEQFEIIWQATGNSYANAPKNILTELKFDPSVKYGGGLGTAVVNGKACYSRILIRAKNNDINKDVNEQ